MLDKRKNEFHSTTKRQRPDLVWDGKMEVETLKLLAIVHSSVMKRLRVQQFRVYLC